MICNATITRQTLCDYVLQKSTIDNYIYDIFTVTILILMQLNRMLL